MSTGPLAQTARLTSAHAECQLCDKQLPLAYGQKHSESSFVRSLDRPAAWTLSRPATRARREQIGLPERRPISGRARSSVGEPTAARAQPNLSGAALIRDNRLKWLIVAALTAANQPANSARPSPAPGPARPGTARHGPLACSLIRCNQSSGQGAGGWRALTGIASVGSRDGLACAPIRLIGSNDLIVASTCFTAPLWLETMVPVNWIACAVAT